MIGVYQITNTKNGKFYVGSSINLVKRRNTHWCDLKNNRHANKYLQAAWNKDGSSSFTFQVLAVVPKSELLLCEQEFIEQLKPHYNMCRFARNRLGLTSPFKGKTHSISSKLKMRGPRTKTGVDRIDPLTGECKEYESGSATEVDGFLKTKVYLCCNGAPNYRTHKGYYWSYR